MFRPSNPSDPHLTMLELQAWQRERDEKKVDFPFIHLSQSEWKLLTKTAKEEVKKTDKNAVNATRLRDLDFIRIYTTDFSDRENFEFCQIRERGRNYLMYIRTIKRQKKIEWIRYIITTAIAVIALIKSFWPEILQFLGRILPPA